MERNKIRKNSQIFDDFKNSYKFEQIRKINSVRPRSKVQNQNYDIVD